jgi:hypothetical protein
MATAAGGYSRQAGNKPQAPISARPFPSIPTPSTIVA